MKTQTTNEQFDMGRFWQLITHKYRAMPIGLMIVDLLLYFTLAGIILFQTGFLFEHESFNKFFWSSSFTAVIIYQSFYLSIRIKKKRLPLFPTLPASNLEKYLYLFFNKWMTLYLVAVILNIGIEIFSFETSRIWSSSVIYKLPLLCIMNAFLVGNSSSKKFWLWLLSFKRAPLAIPSLFIFLVAPLLLQTPDGKVPDLFGISFDFIVNSLYQPIIFGALMTFLIITITTSYRSFKQSQI